MTAPKQAPPHKTKIVATLGPASCSPEKIAALINAGMDVARINGSHGSHEEHAAWIQEVRRQSHLSGKAVAILYDLQGPKIRLGRFAGEPISVDAGDELVLAVNRPANSGELPTDYDQLDQDVEVGQPLLIDDGTVITEVTAVEPGTVRCVSKNDGAIYQRKGINLPQSVVSAPAITDKDRADAIFSVGQGVDIIALSFVRRGSDVQELKALLKSQGSTTPIVAKIEKPQALENLDGILQEAWGVMVARGDLGVELSPEDVPMAQKRIIREANRLGLPVITATQMLDSMRHNPQPTRAEASDVANAVLDGTDGVMLSGETATGKYPVESVRMMVRIIHATEELREHNPIGRRRERGINTTPEAVADACTQVAHHLEARAIAVFTQTGRTAVLISQRRPNVQLVAFTPNPNVRNLLAAVWGVLPIHVEPSKHLESRAERMDASLRLHDLASSGDVVVVSMGAPMAPPGSTNLMMVHRVGMGLS